jgi:hypothetical protein
MPGSAAADCVDATGPNSTPEQIVDAQLSAQALPGQTQTVLEQLQPEGGLSSPTQLRQDLLKGVFRDVPAGGDAAFAAAACPLQGWAMALGNGSYVYHFQSYSDSGRGRFAKTPHLLRGWGRQFCSGAEGDDADDVYWKPLKQMEGKIQDAKSDPESYKSSLLAGIDDSLQLAVDEPQMTDPNSVAATRTVRTNVIATPAGELVAGYEALHQLMQLAVEHQCPQFRR